MYCNYIYIPLLKINKINFITVLSVNFLKIGQLDKIVIHWLFPEYGKHTPSGIRIPFSLRLQGIRIPSGVYLSVFWEQTMDN